MTWSGLALIAGLMGICVSNAAFALPETEVGSRPGIAAQALSVEPADAATAEDADTATADDNAQPTSN
jgi:hypothetical protein